MFSLLHFFVAIEYQDYTALLIIDVSAAFNTINDQILLDRLKEWFGLGGDVLERVVSYFKHYHSQSKSNPSTYMLITHRSTTPSTDLVLMILFKIPLSQSWSGCTKTS